MTHKSPRGLAYAHELVEKMVRAAQNVQSAEPVLGGGTGESESWQSRKRPLVFMNPSAWLVTTCREKFFFLSASAALLLATVCCRA
jgi:hypothetical protein